MNACCTIITHSHLPFADALLRSLRLHSQNAELHVLIVDDDDESVDGDGMHILHLADLGVAAERQVEKYSSDSNKLRWSLKPVLMLHLLKNFERVIYLDPDLCFFSSSDFLFRRLDTTALLLSPHRAPFNPFQYPEKFSMNFLSGLYNAGFLGANSKALSSLAWWAEACIFHMAHEPQYGFLDDQRYLDLIPVLEPTAGILEHEGCNLGSWNLETCRRSFGRDGRVIINQKYDVVFVHFNGETIHHINNGNDALLQPFLKTYQELLLSSKFQRASSNGAATKSAESIFARWRRKLRPRSRFKTLVYKLYQKL